MRNPALPSTLGLLVGLPALHAQEPPADHAAELAKQLSNPISSLISVPFQANWDFGIGSTDATRFTLNVQPVIPIPLSDDWNLILRTIVPVIDAESPGPGIDDEVGLGGRYYVEGPNGGPEWGVRAVFTLLFPTTKPASPAARATSTK